MAPNIWLPAGFIHIAIVFILPFTFLTTTVNSKSISLDSNSRYLPKSRAKDNLNLDLLHKSNEVLSSVPSSTTTNEVTMEPSCEELRAMWRYYKRRSRSQLPNDISQLVSPIFWDMMPRQERPLSTFGLLGNSSPKGRRFRFNKSKTPYGRVMYQPQKPGRGRLRPFDRIRSFGMSPNMAPKGISSFTGPSMNRGFGNSFTQPSTPIVRYTPPEGPSPEGGFQKLKEIVRDERLRESQLAGTSQSSTSSKNEEDEFGKVVVSPPEGLDGRVAHKSKDLMTPFEKIRFGHADELFDRKGSHMFRLRKKSLASQSHVAAEEEGPSRLDLVQFTPYLSATGLVDFEPSRTLEEAEQNLHTVVDVVSPQNNPWTSMHSLEVLSRPSQFQSAQGNQSIQHIFEWLNNKKPTEGISSM